MFFSARSCAAARRAALVSLVVTMFVAGGCSRGTSKPANSISEADREVLVQYEAMRAALADDDIRKAHVAGEKLLMAIDAPGVSASLAKTKNAAKIMAESYRIDLQRVAFKDISAALVPLCRGVEGYYVVTTDLVVDGVWVQTSPVVGNPYLGRSMALYGDIKK